jgi:sucrose-6-phosphate hydrolase SacC (GH32 family)
VEELHILREKSWSTGNVVINKEPFMPEFHAELMDINIVTRVEKGTFLRMNIRGQEILYDRDENRIKYKNANLDLLSNEDLQKFRILVDRASIELFCNGGERALFLPVAMDRENRGLAFSTDGKKVEIKKLEVYSLESVWERLD